MIIPAWLLVDGEGRVFEKGVAYTKDATAGLAFKFTNNKIQFVQFYVNGINQNSNIDIMYLWYLGLK